MNGLSLLPAWKNASAAIDRGDYTYGDLITTSALRKLFDIGIRAAPSDPAAVKRPDRRTDDEVWSNIRGE